MKDLVAKVKSLELRTLRRVDSTFAGAYHSAFKGKGLEFDEVRPYQLGDDVRDIDWNVTARHGSPFVKVFREERELSLCLLFDVSASQSFGIGGTNKREVGSELAAILAFAALKNNDKIGLALCSDQIEHYFPPQKGRKQVLKLIRFLLSPPDFHPGTHLRHALTFLQKVLKQRGIVCIISDFLDKDYATALIRLGKKQEVILIHLFHPEEKLAGISGILPTQDLETGKRTWVQQTSHSMFAGAYAYHFQELQSFAETNGVGYIPVDCTQDYLAALTRFFRRRGANNSKRL